MPVFTPVHYKGYTITFDPPPIPIRTSDYHFIHDDFCCPECDNRAGSAGSVTECMEQIDLLIEERVDEDSLYFGGSEALELAIEEERDA